MRTASVRSPQPIALKSNVPESPSSANLEQVPDRALKPLPIASTSKSGKEATPKETSKPQIARSEELQLHSLPEQGVKLSRWISHVANSLVQIVSGVLDRIPGGGGQAPNPGDDPLLPSDVQVPAAPPPTAPSPAGWLYIAGGFFMSGLGTFCAGYETHHLQPALLALFSAFLMKGGRHVWTFSELAPNSLPRLPDERPG